MKKKDKDSQIAESILRTLETPSEMDRGLENANVVDGLFEIGRAIRHLADVLERLHDRTD